MNKFIVKTIWSYYANDLKFLIDKAKKIYNNATIVNIGEEVNIEEAKKSKIFIVIDKEYNNKHNDKHVFVNYIKNISS